MAKNQAVLSPENDYKQFVLNVLNKTIFRKFSIPTVSGFLEQR